MKRYFTLFEFAPFQVFKTCKWIVALVILFAADQAQAQPLQLVADIAPLTTSSDPQYLTSLNGKLYFSAFRDATGRELYVYDSLSNEVSLVADLMAGIPSSEPKELTVVDSKLYFLARRPHPWPYPGEPFAFALYQYNPLTNKIRLIKPFVDEGPRGHDISEKPSDLTEFNNKLYLLSAPMQFYWTIGRLNVFDPATNQLEVVAEHSFWLGSLTILDGKMYFYTANSYDADSGEPYFEDLWMYDPTTGSTAPVYDNFNPSAYPYDLVAMDSKLYASRWGTGYGDELYVLDPSTNSLTLAADINPTSSSRPKNFAVFNNKLYFQAKGLQGVELFVYDPATLTASQVADIKQGAGNSNPESLFVFNDMLYFSAESDSLGRELFVYDAASNSVSMVADIGPGAASSSPSSFAAFNDKLFFSASHPLYGRELWNASESGILGFSLVNARKDTVIQTINSGDIISLDQLNLYDFNVRAEVASSGISKVVFRLSGGINSSSEDTDPEFLVFDPEGHQAMAGSYTLTATPYYLVTDEDEVQGQSLTTTFIFSSVVHVNNVRLVSAADGAEIGKIKYNTIIDKATYPVTGINILADVTWPQTSSLYFELTGPVSMSKLQNEAPFSLFGDTNGRLHQGSLVEGDYVLTITPYLGKNKAGFAGKPYVVPFKVIDQLEISNVSLIDAATGEKIMDLADNSNINSSDVPPGGVNITADVPNPDVNSVLFELQGPVSITKLQNEPPYSVFGETNGIFNAQQLPDGNYTLTATTYRLANQQGKAGQPVIIHFSKFLIGCSGTLVFDSQEKIDAFNCVSFDGTINIKGYNITNLEGFSELTSVSGDLSIRQTSLSNFLGLQNLTSVEGSMTIEQNSGVTDDSTFISDFSLENMQGLNSLDVVGGNVTIGLTSIISLAGLSNLSTIGGELYVYENNKLLGLGGLSGLESVGGNLTIRGCFRLENVNLLNLEFIGGDFTLNSATVLQNLSGLSTLQTVGGDLMLNNNVTLPNIDGLSGLQTIGGNIKLQGNGLTNLNGLSEAIKTIEGNLTIIEHPKLVNVDGLSSIDTIRGHFDLSRNKTLQHLNGLSGLQSVEGDLIVTENRALTACCGLYPVLSSDGVDGNTLIFFNGSGCSEADILANCASQTSSRLALTEETGAIQSQKIDTDINVYPNPTSDGNLTLEFKSLKSSDANVRIVNLYGNTVFEHVASISEGINQVKLEIPSLDRGVFILFLNIDQQVKFARVIKIK